MERGPFSVFRVKQQKPYVAPVDQYMSTKKDYESRGSTIDQTFENFDGNYFSRTLPLEEYNDPRKVPSTREALGTGASTGERVFLYGGRFE